MTDRLKRIGLHPVAPVPTIQLAEMRGLVVGLAFGFGTESASENRCLVHPAASSPVGNRSRRVVLLAGKQFTCQGSANHLDRQRRDASLERGSRVTWEIGRVI